MPEQILPSQATTPPTPRRQATRDRLISAAAEVFVAEGLQGASVEAICYSAGFSRGAFYSNFSSKEELFLAALATQYQKRVDRIGQQAEALVPQYRNRSELITPAEIALLINQFFAPSSFDPDWIALESEFLLLAMRDTSKAGDFVEFSHSSRHALGELASSLLQAAGRTFLIPANRAVGLLAGLYERALTISAIAGPDAPEGLDELGDRVAELLFVITEPLFEPRASNSAQ